MSLMNVARRPDTSSAASCAARRCGTRTRRSAERIRTDPKAVFEGKLFWCNRTHQAEGPDANRCGADECGPGRTC